MSLWKKGISLEKKAIADILKAILCLGLGESCTKSIKDFAIFPPHQKKKGTPMGSSISPLFAEIVMDDLEVYCLHKLKIYHKCTPLFYYRYVDDTILYIHKKSRFNN